MFTGICDESDSLQPVEETLIANGEFELSQNVHEIMENCPLNLLDDFFSRFLSFQLSNEESLESTFPQVIKARDGERLKLTLDEQEVLITFSASFHRFLSNSRHIDVTVPIWLVPKSFVLLVGKRSGFRLDAFERRQELFLHAVNEGTVLPERPCSIRRTEMEKSHSRQDTIFSSRKPFKPCLLPHLVGGRQPPAETNL